ncbi:MAG TPA: primosomal protein N' [Geobacterales bacterium]|nr:primosomal protein N' [Geobacterales bacterium]
MTHPLSAIVEVAIPLRLDQTFHYRLPSKLVGEVTVGMGLYVPFGRRKMTGYVVALGGEERDDLKEAIDLLDGELLFTPEELEFLRFMATYYHHPLGEVIRSALPVGINRESRSQVTVAEDGSAVVQEVERGGQRPKRERWVRSVAGAAAHLPRGKGEEIWRLLQEQGELPIRELRQRFGEVSSQLKRLVELGLVETFERETYRDPFGDEKVTPDEPRRLTSHQAEALATLLQAKKKGGFAPFLLHGVTGSGKTEVYLQTIAEIVATGESALVLVPEISLTPQLVRRFRSRFGSGIAVLHSGLSDGERFDEWRRIRRGEVRIVIGARSAIFAPLQRLGIIIVDEEHDDSYKQSEGFRYHARDMALLRGKRQGALVMLGSATPLITTLHACREGRIGYLDLPERVAGRLLPTAQIVDLRGKRYESLSPTLGQELQSTLDAGGQALLFLNRRGFATFVACDDCGFVLRCPNCAVTLTHHRGRQRHLCHYCDFSLPAPSVCPECHGGNIGLHGRGTERVEEEVRSLFPDIGIVRMDRDTTSRRGSHERLLRQVERGEARILIGTQMVAKGHDFPGVTLVGVISADATLNLPDFRAAERTFQVVSQVMGRAGRGDQPGRVVIQTLNPEHYAVLQAATHNINAFYDEEIAFRKESGYPPFSHLAALHLSGITEGPVEAAAQQAALLLRRLRQQGGCRWRSSVQPHPPWVDCVDVTAGSSSLRQRIGECSTS